MSDLYTRPTLSPPKKPGYRTTEFWLSVVVVVCSAFVGSGLLPVEHPAIKVAAMIAATLTTLGYNASRASVKK